MGKEKTIHGRRHMRCRSVLTDTRLGERVGGILCGRSREGMLVKSWSEAVKEDNADLEML